MGMFEQDFLAEYSNESLVQEIQRVAGVVTTGPLTEKEFGKFPRVSVSTIRRRFGGWQQALAAAGLVERYSGISITSKMHQQQGKGSSPEEILNEIRRVASIISGRRLTVAEFNYVSAFSAKAVRTAFGSWPRALGLAGICSRNDVQRVKTAQRYSGMLKTAASRLDGRAPTIAGFNALKLGVSAHTIRRFFGTWSEGLSVAGLNLRRTWKQPFTEQECLDNLERLWAALGRQPLYSDVGRPPSTIGPKAYERIWGTYSHALTAYESARGHPTGLNRRTTTLTADRGSLLEELQRVARLAGTTTINQEHVSQFSRIDVRTFSRRFGSWEAAVKQAGLQLSIHANRYDDDELFKNLMAVWEALGRSPKHREMESAPSRVPSTDSIL